MAHARFSPSSAGRRIQCPPSLLLEEQFPDTTSPYAEEGTYGHALAEKKLEQYLSKKKIKTQKSEYHTEELEEAVDEYVQYVIDTIEEGKKAGQVVVSIEQRVDVSAYAEGCFGTADAMVLSNDELHIIDLKLGRGVEVSAENNPQLMCYGLGMLDMMDIIYDIDKVKLSIVQPRINNLSTWTIEASKLKSWGAKVLKPAAELALKGEGEFKSGEHCRFCKARFTCRARANENLELARLEFKEPELLSEAEIGEVLRKAGELNKWCEDVFAWAQGQAIENGKEFDGFKIVEGRSIRQYTDVAKVETAAKSAGFDDIYKIEILGITAMEKLMGKKVFADILGGLVHKPKGKLILVPEEDKREAVQPLAIEFKEE